MLLCTIIQPGSQSFISRTSPEKDFVTQPLGDESQKHSIRDQTDTINQMMKIFHRRETLVEARSEFGWMQGRELIACVYDERFHHREFPPERRIFMMICYQQHHSHGKLNSKPLENFQRYSSLPSPFFTECVIFSCFLFISAGVNSDDVMYVATI